ncbi:cholecystokinin receptor-like, partial [Centruroides sculpturatus]|uniref:cholecystokinin receptor-like n=2 Tax=Centruroides sculpturatus TaxID=218467 RepID=UPI000C6E989F
VSVSVSAWTLVAMSIERYYAICHPLKSREWQTLSHAYRMIGVVWAASLLCMLPISVLSQLQPIRDTDKYKCRESWPSEISEKIFNLFLDVILLVVPLLIMTVTYSFIVGTLWKTIKPLKCQGQEITTKNGSNKLHIHFYPKNSAGTQRIDSHTSLSSRSSLKPKQQCKEDNISYQGIRVSNLDKSLSQKRRVFKMLFVVVLEFFICWTPLYVINTVSLYDPRSLYEGLGYYGISFFQLLAYTSSCCNPITYCFMNSKFRQSFMGLFGCKRRAWSNQCKEVAFRTTLSTSYHDNSNSKKSMNSSTKTISEPEI